MNVLSIYKKQQKLIPLLINQNNHLYRNQFQKSKSLIYVNNYNIISTKEYEKEKPKLSKIRGLLKEFMLVLIEGTKDMYKDVKWLGQTYQKKQHKKFTGFELREENRILYDAFKFLPFSVFLAIPGLEVALPLYLLFFPNSIPTWYIFDHAWDQKITKLEEKQKEAHSVLIHQLRDFLTTKGMSGEDFLNENKYKAVFLKSKKDLDKKLNINKFTSDELILVAKFLGMECITGTFIMQTLIRIILNMPKYIVNSMYFCVGSKKRIQFDHWIFNKEFKFNYGPLEYLKRGLIRYQINRHIKTLKKQDLSFFKYGMHDIQGHNITIFARERGITTISCYETLKVFMQNEFVSVTLNFTNNQLIWYAIMQYDFLEHTNVEFN